MESGQYNDAIVLFDELGNYKQSIEYVDVSKYELAKELKENERYDEAEKIFTEIDGYENSTELIVECIYLQGMFLYENSNFEQATLEFSRASEFPNTLEYVNKSKFQLGIMLKDTGNLVEAEVVFAELGNFENSSELLLEYIYLQGEDLFENSNYEESITYFERSIEYPLSQEKLNVAKEEVKYSRFISDFEAFPDVIKNYEVIKAPALTREETNAILNSEFYYKWFDGNDEYFDFSPLSVNGKDYLVLGSAVESISYDTQAVFFSYKDNPGIIYSAIAYPVVFEFDENITLYKLNIANLSTNVGTEYTSVTLSEWNDISTRSEAYIQEKINSQPRYSDEYILNTTLDLFFNEISSKYPANQVIYHATKYKDPYIHYDSSNKEYTCTFEGLYDTFMFMYPFGAKSYTVSATYIDNGSQLINTSYMSY